MSLVTVFAGRMELRQYQRRIACAAVTKNTIVMLPTGSGKTLIAAEVIRMLGPPAVFFVPTCLLVEQQAAAIRAWSGLKVVEFMGGMHLDSKFDVLVTTPKAFEIVQARAPRGSAAEALLGWSAFRLVVFDEVHHVLKDHPYRKLAAALRRSDAMPRVLGLSASLTYAVGKGKVESAVRGLCSEIGAEAIEVATSDEMTADGYRGGVTTSPEVVFPVNIPQTNPNDDAQGSVVPPEDRKPHLMLPTFLGRIARGTALSFTRLLYNAVRSMENAAVSASLDNLAARSFKSPIDDNLPTREWGEQAHKLAAATGSSYFAQLEHYYEALRLLVVSWEEATDAAATYLRMFTADGAISLGLWSKSARAALDAFWLEVPATFARFEHLCDVLEYKLDSTPGFRGIVFVEQRVMTHILEHVISSCASLNSRLKPACLYATSSPATPSLRVTRAESLQRIAAFSEGRVNVLICTVVAEEGMDVPAANCVIRFDPMMHSVSYVQGRGRARAEGSAYVVLAERPDRPVSLLADAEQQQLALIREVAKGSMMGPGRDPLLERKAQTDRERNAAAAVLSDKAAAAATVDPANALGALNLFCKKTKVVLVEEMSLDEASRMHVAVFTYNSCLRTVVGRGCGLTSKLARQHAAVDILTLLKLSTSRAGPEDSCALKD